MNSNTTTIKSIPTIIKPEYTDFIKNFTANGKIRPLLSGYKITAEMNDDPNQITTTLSATDSFVASQIKFKSIAGVFPDISRFMKESEAFKMEIELQELKKVSEQAYKIDNDITIFFGNQSLHLQSYSQSEGYKNITSLPMQAENLGNATPTSGKISVKYLHDFSKNLFSLAKKVSPDEFKDKKIMVKISQEDKNKPLVIKVETNEFEIDHLIMPLKS